MNVNRIQTIFPVLGQGVPVITRIAVLMLWGVFVSYLWGMVDGLASMPSIEALSHPGVSASAVRYIELCVISVFILYAVLKLFFLFKLSARKNWARITLIVMTALLVGVALYPIISTHLPRAQWHPKNLVSPVFEVVAIILLLMPSSAGWFRSNRPAITE